jgi:hypothetical protein
MSNVDTSDVPTHKVEGCGPMTNTAAHKQHLLLLLVLLYFLYFSLLVGNMQMIFKSSPTWNPSTGCEMQSGRDFG